MAGIRFDLDLPIGPEWRNADLLRSAILNCLAAVFHNDDFSTAVSMIAGELVENAIKYGDWSERDRSQFKLHVRGDERGVDVLVVNPIGARAQGEEVLRTVSWIAGFPSPADAYRARLKQIAESPQASSSKLGLARIAYEGNCDLHASIDDHLLSVRARSRPRAGS